ncbi:MAG: hypothetical protein HY975_04065 [Candidatus Kerfeldbacteria bacterium]|nr:hypothetical protein [Candidatus Kerfeldbacteria bacterium]
MSLVIEGHPFEGDLNITQVLVEPFDWSGWHEYELIRDTEGEVALFVDGMPDPIVSYPYAALNMETVGFWGVMFGNVTENAVVTSEWDYVRYNIGRSQPGGCVSADGKMELLSLIHDKKQFNPAFEINRISGQARINAIDGLPSNTQNHKFFLRTQLAIRNAAGTIVRNTLDDAQIGPLGKGENPPFIVAFAMGEWDGRDSSGNIVNDGEYNYQTNVSFVRVDGKGKVKTISAVSAPGALAVTSARALALTPTCATSPGWTLVPFGFSQDYWPRDRYGGVQNNVHWSEPIVMSANVAKYKILHRVPQYWTLPSDRSWLGYRDSIGVEGPPSGTWSYQTGDDDENERGKDMSYQETPTVSTIRDSNRMYSRGGIKFDSNSDGMTGRGVKFDVIALQCDNDGKPGNTYFAQKGQAIEIVLHSSSPNQVVYFWTYAPYNTEMVVTMKPLALSPFGTPDIKIYGDWSHELPSESTNRWQGGGPSVFNNAAFKVPASYNVNQKVYFAVQAYSGGGTVRVHLTPVHQKAKIPLTVCTEPGWKTATPEEKAQMKFAIKRGAEAWFAMADGESYFSNINVWLSDGMYPCDVYVKYGSGRSRCLGGCTDSPCPNHAVVSPNRYVDWYRSTTKWAGWDHGSTELRGRVFAHEMGHLKACLKDEYFADGPNEHEAFCGHSIMASTSRQNDMCTVSNHCLDPDVVNTKCKNIQSDAWSRFTSQFVSLRQGWACLDFVDT